MVATITVVIIKYLSYKLKLLGVVPLKNTPLQEIVLPNIWQNSRGVRERETHARTHTHTYTERVGGWGGGETQRENERATERPRPRETVDRKGEGGGGEEDVSVQNIPV